MAAPEPPAPTSPSVEGASPRRRAGPADAASPRSPQAHACRGHHARVRPLGTLILTGKRGPRHCRRCPLSLQQKLVVFRRVAATCHLAVLFGKRGDPWAEDGDSVCSWSPRRAFPPNPPAVAWGTRALGALPSGRPECHKARVPRQDVMNQLLLWRRQVEFPEKPALLCVRGSVTRRSHKSQDCYEQHCNLTDSLQGPERPRRT